MGDTLPSRATFFTPLANRPLSKSPRGCRSVRWKAEASAWLAEHGYTVNADALAERQRLLDTRGGTYLWNLDLNIVEAEDRTIHALLADTFSLTADVLAFFLEADTPKDIQHAAELLAECQCAFHHIVAYARGGMGNEPDPDQYEVFRLLRVYGAEEEVYLFFLRRDADVSTTPTTTV